MTQPANEFLKTEQPVTPDDLADVERLLGFTFPPEIRNHYLAFNGGCARKYLFDRNGTIHVLQEFLPVKYGRVGGRFEHVNRDLKIEEEILPQHLFALANDPGGDFYCFSVRQHDAGSIWFYTGEYSDEPDRAVRFLASNLGEFLAGMRLDEDRSDWD